MHALHCAYIITNPGRVQDLSWENIAQTSPDKILAEMQTQQKKQSKAGNQQENKQTDSTPWLWIHLDPREEGVREWLETKSGLPAHIVASLNAMDSRPRASAEDMGDLIILRGVNLNPNADPEDMISIRLWVQDNMIISTQLRKLQAIEELKREFTEKDAPVDPGAFILRLIDGLIRRMSAVLDGVADEIDLLEDLSQRGGTPDHLSHLRARLAQQRHKIIPLRRYLTPQRDALISISGQGERFLDPHEIKQAREITDRVVRYVEDLDAMYERSQVIQDSLAAHLAERTNRTMLLLSIVTTIFLPLGLLSGLLGMNVGGIPWAQNDLGFWIICGLMTVIALILLAIFRRLKLF